LWRRGYKGRLRGVFEELFKLTALFLDGGESMAICWRI
jgi:hypothetical protein